MADRPLRLFGIEIGTRMTVIQLREGTLLLHSPVLCDGETRRALDALGSVRFVLAPNKVHHFFVAPWKAAYPTATLLAAPGLREKRPKIPFDGALEGDPPEAWRGFVEAEHFRGAQGINEIVLFHEASRTLVLTDLAMNFHAAANRRTDVWQRLFGVHNRFGPTRFVRFLIRDHQAARGSLQRILGWDFERITLAHGEVLEAGGKAALRDAYAWL
ncbi:MAG TPA: DUF4336 domain-containing protein [Myxococcota bacterium]|nr:DUF4336 domain-containing protein [Myxococcota bacterium]